MPRRSRTSRALSEREPPTHVSVHPVRRHPLRVCDREQVRLRRESRVPAGVEQVFHLPRLEVLHLLRGQLELELDSWRAAVRLARQFHLTWTERRWWRNVGIDRTSGVRRCLMGRCEVEGCCPWICPGWRPRHRRGRSRQTEARHRPRWREKSTLLQKWCREDLLVRRVWPCIEVPGYGSRS